MTRYSRRDRYMMDRAERRGRRNRDRMSYPMDYRSERSEYGRRSNTSRGRDRHYYEDDDMEYEQPREYYGDYNYDMRRNRDYAYDDYDKEYHKDLMEWAQKLKKDDRFGWDKNSVIQKAREMGVSFNGYDEEEFYAIYLMHISDYPSIANEPHTYLTMAKAWLEDKDIDIEPSEKVCKYLYEIVMADED